MKRLIGILLAGICMAVMLFPGSAMADAAIGGEYNYQDASFYVVVDAPDGYVNFRYGPGVEYGVYFPIYNGEVLYVDATMDNYYDGLYWGRTTYNGYIGWISISQTSYIDVNEPQQADPYYADTYPVSYAVIVDAWDGYVNLREGPGLAYEIRTSIDNGVVLYITSEGYNEGDGLLWGETEYNGNYGWISLNQTSNYVPDPDAGRGLETVTEPATASPVQPEPETIPAVQPEPEQKTVQNTGNPVSDAYYSVTKRNDYDYIFAIPQINLASDEIQQLNRSIYDTIYPEIQDAIAGRNPVEDLMESSYIWYLNADILSLVIYNRFGGPWHEYNVYNISVSEERVLDNREFLKAAGWAESQYTQLAQTALETVFNLLNQNNNQEEMDTDQQAAFDKCKEDTLSIYNIAECMPYMNGEGQMYIIGKINVFQSQNGISWTDINLTNPLYDEEAQAFFATVKSTEGSVDLRTGPGTSFDLQGTVPYGQKLYIVETQEDGKDGITWGKTSWNGMHGWVPLGEDSVSAY